MPNWCHNHLVVSGPEDIVEEFANKGYRAHGNENEETQLSLEQFLPTPVEMLDNVKGVMPSTEIIQNGYSIADCT